MPLFYNHWSFGEDFVRQYGAYKRGMSGLAYEIVINSNPCIAFLMEDNTMMMQTLVTAHACIGHNTFFKNNYLFRKWTDASSIIDYLSFAKRYIRECEDKYGIDEVEHVLDAAHSLQFYGVDKYKRPPKLSVKEEETRRIEREKYTQSQLNELWNTIPVKTAPKNKPENEIDEVFPKEPQENILYFLEKNAPKLRDWEREIIRIVRKISQYFYPQIQTKLMNEGCACFFHYKIVHDLYDEGIIDEGAMLEFYSDHTAITYQPDFTNLNPYALGHAMFREIERVSTNPTDEDREWFTGQDWVGRGDYMNEIKKAVENFKDESFILQYLTPKTIRDFRLFAIKDDEKDMKILVTGIHNQQGYKKVREIFAQNHNIGYMIPDIQVVEVDRWGDRTLFLEHRMVNNRPLEKKSAIATISYLEFLWGYDVKLDSINDQEQIICNYEEGEDKLTSDTIMIPFQYELSGL
jgi:stage V sporulation protein R